MNKRLLGFVLAVATMGFAQTATCHSVGETASTNFLTSTTTAGTSTGDLKGAIGVTVLSITPGLNGSLVLHNQHFWVLDTGDMVFLQDSDATAYPTPIAGFDAAIYVDGIKVVGGTGRYAGATGKLTSEGAADLNKEIGRAHV